MSALPPKADIRCCDRHVRFVPKGDIPVECALGVVGTREQRLRDGKAERLCGFQIHDQLVFGGRLHRQVRGLTPLRIWSTYSATRRN